MQRSPKGSGRDALVSIATALMSSHVALFPSFQRRCGKSGNLSLSSADVWGSTSNPKGCMLQEVVQEGGGWKAKTDLCAGRAGGRCCCTGGDICALASNMGR